MTPPNTTADEMVDRFRRFAEEEGAIFPFYGHLAAGIANDAPDVAEILAAGQRGQRRPLLLFAAVHFLLLGGLEHRLARFYRSITPDADDDDPLPAFLDFCRRHRDAVADVVGTRNIQTNEVGRAAALWPGLVTAGRVLGDTVALVEVGASAGLNLLADRYAYTYDAVGAGAVVGGDPDSPVEVRTELRGPHVPPIGPAPRIVERVGIDLSPVDLTDDDRRRWLLACVFPDHVERAARLRSALDLAREHPPPVLQGDAVEHIVPLVDALPGDLPVVVWHSVAVTYFSRDDRERFDAALRDAAQRRPLVRVSFEHVAVLPDLVLDRPIEVVDGTVLGLEHMGRPGPGRALALAQPHVSWIEWLGERRGT